MEGKVREAGGSGGSAEGSRGKGTLRRKGQQHGGK